MIITILLTMTFILYQPVLSWILQLGIDTPCMCKVVRIVSMLYLLTVVYIETPDLHIFTAFNQASRCHTASQLKDIAQGAGSKPKSLKSTCMVYPFTPTGKSTWGLAETWGFYVLKMWICHPKQQNWDFKQETLRFDSEQLFVRVKFGHQECVRMPLAEKLGTNGSAKFVLIDGTLLSKPPLGPR